MKKRIITTLMACILIISFTSQVAAANDDFDAVTNHIAIAPAKQLAILYPTKNIQTTAAGYQLTGTSAPGQTLTMNGNTVEGRGSNGTFAVYVSLENGANTFTFRQGNSSASITITKGNANSPSTAVTNLEELPKPLPQFDLVLNPSDFDSMCSKQGIYDTVTTISDGIIVSVFNSGNKPEWNFYLQYDSATTDEQMAEQIDKKLTVVYNK